MGGKFEQLGHKPLEQDNMEGVEDHEWVSCYFCYIWSYTPRSEVSEILYKMMEKGVTYEVKFALRVYFSNMAAWWNLSA